MTDHKKDFEASECETTTKFEQSEANGNIYGLVSMGYYLFASLMIYGLLNIYGLLKSKYLIHFSRSGITVYYK